MSHPVWVRGLKLYRSRRFLRMCDVAPRVGAWIETIFFTLLLRRQEVAPRVGAWIETCIAIACQTLAMSRTLCGCVD